ncbi:MAG: alpha/beta hydrolase [Nakamurella sp.]
MQLALVNGVHLEYEVFGSGEAVLLLHGGLLTDENRPLAQQAALADHFRVVNYHRRGFAGSTSTGQPTSIETQAADGIALIEHLGLGSVHLVGHSLGGAIALQIALFRPDLTRSLVLMEPALMGQIVKVEAESDPEMAASQVEFQAEFAKVLAIAATGDKRAALMAFLEGRAGDSVRAVLDFLTSTGEFDQAVLDADTFLQIEMPSAFAWSFTPKDAARIRQPVLSVLGTDSPGRAELVHEVLCEWLPQTELLTLDKAEHALPLLDPPGLANDIAAYLHRVAAAECAGGRVAR